MFMKTYIHFWQPQKFPILLLSLWSFNDGNGTDSINHVYCQSNGSPTPVKISWKKTSTIGTTNGFWKLKFFTETRLQNLTECEKMRKYCRKLGQKLSCKIHNEHSAVLTGKSKNWRASCHNCGCLPFGVLFGVNAKTAFTSFSSIMVSPSSIPVYMHISPSFFPHGETPPTDSPLIRLIISFLYLKHSAYKTWTGICQVVLHQHQLIYNYTRPYVRFGDVGRAIQKSLSSFFVKITWCNMLITITRHFKGLPSIQKHFL